MRWRVIDVMVMLLFVFALGCEENQTSFFIEHVKVPPDAPDCTVSVSDGIVPGGLLDLSFRNPYGGWYLVANHLKAREDFGNLVAESNGIIIDGMEVYVRGLNGSLIGGTEYYEFENFVPPEERSIAFAFSLPPSVVAELAERYSCPQVWSLDGPTDTNVIVYSVVRFIGHTNGNVDVETPEFTFPIELCCGCLVEWGNCIDPCSRYCDDPEEHGMCTLGVSNGGDLFDCRFLYHDPDATWDCMIDPGDGVPVPGICTCADCKG